MPPPNLRPLVSADQIARRLSALAHDIPAAIPARERPIAIVVLQGAFIFAADLLRALPRNYPIDVAFLRCQSYGAEMHSSGRILLLQDIDPDIDLRNRTVLLIDDIMDTGLTMKFLMRHLRDRGARKVKLCVLMHRTKAPGRKRLKPDFVGFPAGTEFVVGYGLDYAGRYRNLPDLAALKVQPTLNKRATRKAAL